MQNPLQTILLAALLAAGTITLNNEYELSRGRKMWTGMQHAVHYYDHFSLLTSKMSGIMGTMTSNYPFVYKSEWSLALELGKMGQALSEKDGFMLLLSPNSVNSYEGNRKPRSRKRFLRTMVRSLA